MIVEDWAIPRRDPFSFTASGEPWTVYSWLASAGMGLLDKAWGDNGIQLARAALTVSIAVIAWRLTRPARSLAGRIIATAIVLVVGTSAWTERPLLGALVLMALLVLVVETEDLPRWPVIVVMWLWVNVHGSFPFGLVYLLVRLAGRRLDGNPLGRLPRLLGLAFLGTLAGGLNPIGPRLLIFPFELLSRHDLLDRVSEWRSPNFSRPPNLALLGGLLVALLLCSRRHRYEDGLVALVFGASACLAVRNSPLATLVLAPVLARAFANLGTIQGERRSPATAMAGGLLVVASVFMAADAIRDPAYDLRNFPVRQLDWMGSQGLTDKRVATEDFVGNLIIARRGRDANVFFDDRFDMYPRKVVAASIALLDGREGWQKRLDAYKVDVVLWQRSRPLAGLLALDPGWKIVRRDKGWVIAVRISDTVRPPVAN